ncbi:hypothetical protein E4T56_gene2508 [Termitomyces sp. T112]|nr:hypothetical protein E4T56_gene2508 [Termitomyces sp. T112]
MKPATALSLCVLPLLALAQSNSTNSSQAVITSTSLSAFVTMGPGRQISTGTSTIVLLSTLAPTQSASPNNTVSGNSTVSGNTTTSGNSTTSQNATSTSTSSINLPTAPTTVAVGGGPNGAPLPGASGGAFGPDDKFTAAASTIARNTMLIGAGGLVLTGALMVL